MLDKRRIGFKAQALLKEYLIFIVFGVIFIIFSILLAKTGFLSLGNLMNVARQATPIAIMAIGITFVLCTGEIDLSIGSTVALSSVITAMLLRDFNIYVALLGGLSIGAIIGLINGLLTTKLKIPSFLVTLGMMSILLGIARWITDIKPISVTNKAFIFIFGLGTIGRIPLLLIWTLLAMAIGQVVLKKTTFGRKVYAVGGNIIAAKYTGINVDLLKIKVFIISGVLASLAGMVYAGRLQGARYDLGADDPLVVIAAAVIGGTSLFGGKGTAIGAVLGAIILGVINNGIILLGLSLDQQIIARGSIIIIAVAFGARSEA